MMEKKQFIKPLVTITVIAIIVGVYLLFNWEEIQPRDLEADRRAAFENTRDNYISLLNENKEDFDYVARVIGQWSRCGIYFDDYGKGALPEIIYFDDYLSSNNQEIIDELTNNKEFYNHVMKIYDTGGFYAIYSSEEDIEFGLSNPPIGCHGELQYYIGNIDNYTNSGVLQKIDDHWGITIVGNI